MTKENRHQIIKDIIKNNSVANQSILLDILTRKGFEITQATLSRDIKELKVIKVPTEDGSYVYQLPGAISNGESSNNNSHLTFLSIEFSGNLAIAKTKPGYAMAMAGEIDKDSNNTILGTVAGDDTILLIPKEGKTRTEVLFSLNKYIPNNLK